MRTSTGHLGVAVTFLSLVFTATSVVGQHDVHATIVPSASRKPAPAFRLADMSGKAMQITDYRGKVVLLNFWATECGGCKIEMPWFIELETAHKGEHFTVVGISMDISYENLKSADEAWSKVKPFVMDHKLNYPILMGDDVVSNSYDLEAYPATYLIDKDGRIAATYVGVVDKNDVDSNINKLLAER